MLELEEPAVGTEEETASPDDEQRLRRASMLGGLAATVVFVAILSMSGANFLSESWTTHFYPEQASSLLELRWDVPQDIVGIEGFGHNDKWYLYYGPFPAILRMPVVAVSEHFADRMTQLSMLAAFVVALWGTARLSRRTRYLLRGDDPVTRAECWAAGGFVFVVGAGSVLLFLASQAWVYHEAELWGAALAIVAFDAIVAYLMDHRRKMLVIASALTALALLSRASVGLGPAIALGVLAIAALTATTRRAFGITGLEGERRIGLWLAAAAAAPLGIYAYTNYAKFGTLFVFPTGEQLMSKINPQRKLFLAESGGSYFNLKFIPTTVFQYFRPDALRVNSLAPWIDVPNRARVFGGARFDAIEPTSSIPASMPALFGLSVVGLVYACKRIESRVARLRAPLIGATVAACAALPFGYIAQRYLSDFIPVLVLAGLMGLHLLLRWTAHTERRRAARNLWLGFAFLFGFSVLVNIGLAVNYHWMSPWLREEEMADFIVAQHDAPQLPLGTEPAVERGAVLPERPSPRGTLFVLGDCEAVYWSAGPIPSLAWSPWYGVQRAEGAGEYRLRVTFDKVPRRMVLPLVVGGNEEHAQAVAALVSPQNRVRFGFTSQVDDDLPRENTTELGFWVGKSMKFVPGKAYDITVILDENNGVVSVERDGRHVFSLPRPELTPLQNQHQIVHAPRLTVGRNTVDSSTEASFAGRIEELPIPRPPLCDALDGR